MDEKGKKPGLAVMIALGAKKKMDAGKDEPNRHSDTAQELLDAIRADDVGKFGELLHEYVLSCINEGDQGDQGAVDEGPADSWSKSGK